MARLLDIFFEKQASVLEIVLRQVFHRFVVCTQLFLVPAQTYADTATPRRAFQHDRVTDMSGLAQGIIQAFEQSRARQQRYLVLQRQFAGRVLQAERTQLVGGGANEGNAMVSALLGKFSFFTEEAISWMNGICPR